MQRERWPSRTSWIATGSSMFLLMERFYLTQRILLPSTVGIWWVKALKKRKYPVASVSVRFRSKERGTRVKDRAKNGTSKRAERGWGRKEGNSVSFLPLPLPPLSFFGSHFISRAAKTGLSLLRHQMETLATQATASGFHFLTSWTWSIFLVEVNVLVA